MEVVPLSSNSYGCNNKDGFHQNTMPENSAVKAMVEDAEGQMTSLGWG
jgi:hypothetical protein